PPVRAILSIVVGWVRWVRLARWVGCVHAGMDPAYQTYPPHQTYPSLPDHEPFLRRPQCVLEQHGNREGTDAARHGSERPSDVHGVGMHIADEDRSAALEVLPSL